MPTRVARHLDEHGASIFLRAVEGGFKASCGALTLMGLTLAAWAIFFNVPEPLQASNGAPPSTQQQHWHLIILLVGGLALAAVSTLGFIAASHRSIWLLNTHLVFLSVLMAAQLCVVVSVYSQGQEGGGAPHKASSFGGQEESDEQRLFLKRLLVTRTEEDDKQLAELIMVSVAGGLQVLALMMGCMLQSMYAQIDEAAQDLEEEATSAPALRRPLIGTRPPGPARHPTGPEDPAAAEWRARMQERYGLDTSAFTYDPSGVVSQDSAPQLVPYPRQDRCTIM